MAQHLRCRQTNGRTGFARDTGHQRFRYTRQALSNHEQICEAFRPAKVRLLEGRTAGAARKPKTPEEQALSARLARRDAEVIRLRAENQRLMERPVVWLYNAQVRGISEVDLDHPFRLCIEVRPRSNRVYPTSPDQQATERMADTSPEKTEANHHHPDALGFAQDAHDLLVGESLLHESSSSGKFTRELTVQLAIQKISRHGQVGEHPDPRDCRWWKVVYAGECSPADLLTTWMVDGRCDLSLDARRLWYAAAAENRARFWTGCLQRRKESFPDDSFLAQVDEHFAKVRRQARRRPPVLLGLPRIHSQESHACRK